MKTIILFNSKDNSYTIIGTNYTDEQAAKEIENLRKDSLPAFSIVQDYLHYEKADAEAHVNKIMAAKK